MTTPNAVRRKQIEDVLAAWKRSQAVATAGKEVSEEIAKRKEKEEK